MTILYGHTVKAEQAHRLARMERRSMLRPAEHREPTPMPPTAAVQRDGAVRRIRFVVPRE